LVLKKFEVEAYYTSIESVAAKIYFTKFSLPISLTIPLKVSTLGHTSIIYCDKKWITNGEGFSLNFGILIEPFPLEIWAAILSSIAFYIVIIPRFDSKAKSSLNELLNLLSNVFGHEAAERMWYFSPFCAIGYLASLYGNGLTSLITAPTKPASIQTVSELLEKGYKIIYLQKLFALPVETKYEHDWKLLGLKDRINNSFYVLENATLAEEAAVEMAKGKLAALAETSVAEMTRAYYKTKLKKFSPYFRCIVLEQTIAPQHFYWNLRTENQHWLWITILRMKESGIANKWDEWSAWYVFLKSKWMPDNFKKRSTYIGYGDILSIELVYFGITIAFTGVLCKEVKITKLTVSGIIYTKFKI